MRQQLALKPEFTIKKSGKSGKCLHTSGSMVFYILLMDTQLTEGNQNS